MTTAKELLQLTEGALSQAPIYADHNGKRKKKRKGRRRINAFCFVLQAHFLLASLISRQNVN